MDRWFPLRSGVRRPMSGHALIVAGGLGRRHSSCRLGRIVGWRRSVHARLAFFCYFDVKFCSRWSILLSCLSLLNEPEPGHMLTTHGGNDEHDMAPRVADVDPIVTYLASPAPPLRMPGLSLPHVVPCGPSLSPVICHMIQEEQALPCGLQGTVVSTSETFLCKDPWTLKKMGQFFPREQSPPGMHW